MTKSGENRKDMQEGCDGSLLTEQTACMPGSLRSKHIEMKRSGIEMTCFESSKNNKSESV
ncbi:hypothetical protein FYJ75_07160 [Roseburia sp. MUC/MUC-530-WT-4D]|uniref:Uncharacterized protein n=1 Tax=Roseburia porci TaxID=2605790 RepID=A0A6L5YSZ8_9FIRM|nr:hypothetical protein [Roseburia porci]